MSIYSLDRSNSKLICMQVPHQHLDKFSQALSEIMFHKTSSLTMHDGTIIEFISTETVNDFTVDATNRNLISIRMPREVIESILQRCQAYLSHGCHQALDYSLESRGATIMPASVTDFVFETILEDPLNTSTN